MKTPLGGRRKPERGYPGPDRIAEGAAQAVAEAIQPKETRKRDRRRLVEGLRKQTGSFWRKRRASGCRSHRWKQGRKPLREARDRLGQISSKASLLPPAVSKRAAVTGGGSSFGSGGHGPGDRRETRMPLPARVEHAAETRRIDPSGSERRSPVTWGLAAMPAPFCCPAGIDPIWRDSSANGEEARFLGLID